MDSVPQGVVSGRSQPGAKALPPDCVLLPLDRGALLVSREHAVFCRIPPEEVAAVRAAIAGSEATYSPALHAELERHGCFGPPREPRPNPPSVQLQLTNACNLACAYCCTNSGRARASELGLAELREVVRQIPESVGADALVALLGGEPLLVPWALDLAEEVLRQGLRLTLFTNGIQLAQDGLAERSARLVRQGMQVRVSLGGPTPETCDAISGQRRYGAALQGLARLAAAGGQATVDLMFTPQHAGAVAQSLPALQAQLPRDTKIALGVIYLSGRETGEHMFPSREELETALDRVAFEAGVTIPATRASPVMNRREGCGCAMGNHIHVRSDGTLFNCFKMEERVGHLNVEGFAAAARTLRANPHRASELSTCAACPLATLCGGGCRSENQLYTGDPDTPPCGPWRVRVISELLAEDRVSAVEWPVGFLLAEARRRAIEAPELLPRHPSRHLIEI